MPVTVGPTSPAKRGPYMTKKRRRMLEASAEVTPVAKHTGSLTTIHMAPTVTVQSIRTAPNEKHVPVPLRTYTCGLPEPPIDAAQDAVGSQPGGPSLRAPGFLLGSRLRMVYISTHSQVQHKSHVFARCLALYTIHAPLDTLYTHPHTLYRPHNASA